MFKQSLRIALALSMLPIAIVAHGKEPEAVFCREACSIPMTTVAEDDTKTATIESLNSIDTLRDEFNATVGTPRLILLLSPTCPVCVEGAQWVQNDVFEKYPKLELEAFVVWMPILPTDARDKWNASLIDDPRAKHFWNDTNTVGKWFADNAGACPTLGRVAWDAYYVFDAQAKWRDDLDKPLSCETPVIRHSDELGEAIAGIADEQDGRAAAK